MSQNGVLMSLNGTDVETVVGQEQPTKLVHRIDGHTRRVLNDRIATALSAAGRQSSPAEQFKLRAAGRGIARDVFGREFVRAARTHLRKGGIIQFENLPTTEEDADDPGSDRLTRGQALAAVICQATTDSIAYQQEDGGRHYQRLSPVPGVVNGGKTPDALLTHLDNPFLMLSAQPEAIHLYCVNNDSMASTKFITMPAVLRGLREGFGATVIELLQHPAYVSAVSNSFVTDTLAKSATTRPRPVLCGNKEGEPTRFLAKAFDIAVVSGIDNQDQYEWALAAYLSVVKEREDLAFNIMARPGTALSFNQVKMLHGRGSILAGKYREMVRGYGRFSFTKLLSHIGSVPPHFVFDASVLIDR